MDKLIDSIIEQKLLALHTSFIAKVISVKNNAKYANVQPLMSIKQYGQESEPIAILTDVIVSQSARYKMEMEEKEVMVSPETSEIIMIPNLSPLAAGDLVICVCSERDISQAKNGQVSSSTAGRHSLSDAMIVGIL